MNRIFKTEILILSELVSSYQYFSEAPSNIALVKYWGKKKRQIPLNPSISFTLKNSISKMNLELQKNNEFALKVMLDGVFNENFTSNLLPKILGLKDYFDWIDQYRFFIKTTNTFPHSAGIASSASSMCALAQCLLQADKELRNSEHDQNFLSRIARLLSGSAGRSVSGPIMHWGIESDEYASNLNDYHQIFATFRDTILVVDDQPKSISSTEGHRLMNSHPYRESRIKLAGDHSKLMLTALKEGDLDLFGHTLEQEALGLHALMMTSDPSYCLMKPLSLEIIQKLKEYRDKTKVQCFFTLDAGPNIHLLYPEQERAHVAAFLATINVKSIIEDRVSL